MSKAYAPSLEQTEALGFRCLNETSVPSSDDFVNICPPMMGCFYSEELGDTDDIARCHCGGIWVPSGKDYPTCSELTVQSFLPIGICAFSVAICAYCLGRGIYIVTVLRTLKQLQMNVITQALFLSIIGVFFVFLHQLMELMQIFRRDPDFHIAVYGNGGILQICLGGIGLCLVLSSLKIPLLWITIATSGMNKAQAAKNKKRVTSVVKYTSIFFLVTFMAIMFVAGSASGGQYAILWMLILLATFQWGSRKLAKQLVKEGEEIPKAVKDMKYYVRRYSTCTILYILTIIMYIMNAGITSADPRNWAHWASLIYHVLAQLYVSNFIYIRASLDKKLKKFKETGKVTPSSVASTAASNVEE